MLLLFACRCVCLLIDAVACVHCVDAVLVVRLLKLLLLLLLLLAVGTQLLPLNARRLRRPLLCRARRRRLPLRRGHNRRVARRCRRGHHHFATIDLQQSYTFGRRKLVHLQLLLLSFYYACSLVRKLVAEGELVALAARAIAAAVMNELLVVMLAWQHGGVRVVVAGVLVLVVALRVLLVVEVLRVVGVVMRCRLLLLGLRRRERRSADYRRARVSLRVARQARVRLLELDVHMLLVLLAGEALRQRRRVARAARCGCRRAFA